MNPDIQIVEPVEWECPYEEYRHYAALGSTDCKRQLEDGTEIDPLAAAFGHAGHAAVLEPDTFDERVVVGPKVDRRLKKSRPNEGRLCAADYEQWLAEHAVGKVVVTQADFDLVRACADAVLEHPMAGEFFKHPRAKRESCVAGVYDDGLVRVPVKSRRDIALANTVVDLKFLEDASAGVLESRSLFRFGYDLQGSLYADLHEALTGKPARFVIVAVQKSPPHRVGVYELVGEWRVIGRRRYVAACRLAMVERKTEHARRWWEKPLTLFDPPAWAFKETQRVEEYALEMATAIKDANA